MTSSKRYQGFLLVLISFLALYFEIALIRWIPGQIRIVGYFTNLVLIAAVLGLGVGCATPHRAANDAWNFPLRLALLAGACLVIHELGTLEPGDLWGESYFALTEIGPVPAFLAAILIFVGTAWVLLPVGRMLGRALEPFSPLPAYSLNLIGGILGVGAMAGFHRFSAQPVWWFALGLLLYIPFLWQLRGRRLRALALVTAVAVLAEVWLATGDEIWSPYYKIRLENFITLKFFNKKLKLPLGDAGYALTINENLLEMGLNLHPRYLKSLGKDQMLLRRFLQRNDDYYHVPYEFFHPQSVLILGAGMGNDVAQALRNGVRRIDAVEIDPVIAELGVMRHPEHPYEHPAVHLIVDDARHYLRTTSNQYDMVVYGTLDSQRLLSYIATVRMDNFVYTLEGLQEAASRLKPDGVLMLAHASGRNSPQSLRLFRMLEQIFPGRVHLLQWDEPLIGISWDIFLAGPTALPKQIPGLKEGTESYRSLPPVKLPTDNWPFLYLYMPSFWNTDFFKTLLILVLLSLLIVRRTVPEMRSIQPHFFLLGAGFLLLETKSIIELSLLFGSTWVVNTVVIGAFLVMALLANLAVHWFRLQNRLPFFLLLFAALALNAYFPVSRLAAYSEWVRVLGGGGLMALPVLFAGVVFALSFQKAVSAPAALGANVMGAVVGGFCEYTSMYWGYRSLYLVAALFYLAAAIWRPKK